MHRRIAAGLPLILVLIAGGCSTDPAEHVARGDAYRAEGKLPEAVVEYRSAIQQDPRLGDVRLKLAQTYEQLQQPGNAGREYIRAADLLPDNADVQLKAGTFLLLGGQHEDAKSRAEKALAVNPHLAEALILKASAMANLKDLDGAIREVEQALRANPDEPRMRGSLGVLELARGNTAEAERELRRAVELDPASATSHLSLAAFLLQTNRAPEAESALLAAHKLDPRAVLTNRALAIFYRVTNPARAEPYFVTLSELSPDGSGGLALADYYIAMRRPVDARRVLDGLMGNERLFAETRRRVAALLAAEKKPAEAQAILGEVLAKQPDDVGALLLRARLLDLEGKPGEAMTAVQAALKADPNSVEGHYAQGELHAKGGRTDEAIAAFNEVLRLNPRVAGAQLELARLNLAKVGGAATGVDYAQQVLAQQPGNPLAQLTLARGLLMQGDVARAERELAPLLTRFPKAPSVLAQMGNVLVAKRDAAGARQRYEQALALDSDHLEALAGLTALDVAARRFDSARGRIDAKLAERPNQPALIELAARAALAANDSAGAERLLRRLIDVAPERLGAYSLLARIYVQGNKLEAARTELTRLAEKQERAVGARTLIGMLYEYEGRADEARKVYEQVLAAEPTAAVAANNLAWMMAERNENLDLALKYAQAAKAALPEQAEVSDTLGWVYYKKDLSALAVEPLRHAISKDPKNAAYHYRLGLVYLKTGDTAQARRSLQQALTLNPTFEHAADAKSKLGAL
jgi:tetratricopeptide (TPR) repeat protein